MAEAKKPFDELELLKEWQASADLKPALYDHLRKWVPRIYCHKEESNPKEEEEEQVQRQLLRPLEYFLFGEDPDEGVKKLKQGNSSSQLCGRVFKEGETVYSCRDCAIDPTCVLCMDCFQESVHKSHRYKMHASSGGGFCDCGDVEAWKIGPCCSKHDPEAATAMVTNECTLEPELCQRIEMLFRVLLNYFTYFMDWAEGRQLFALLKPEEKDNTYFCMLYNDEHHSYDHVIYTLQRSVNCDQAEAQTHTALIDKEGRRAVKKGSLESCQQAKDLIKYNSEHISLQPLRVEVLHSTVVAHQTFALRLGCWFQKIIGYSVGFRQAFCRVALEPNTEQTNVCCISRLMLLDAKLYKGARKIVHELIFCSILMETEFKRLFAIEFTKLYKDLQHNFIDDDHERSISITALSVQIFTVPTLARYLIEETNVITRIVNTVMALLMEHLDVNNRFFFLGYNSDKFSRIQVIFHDLRYILISIPSIWSCKLRKQFKEGFNAFLGLLKCMQGMEEVVRQFGQHIAVEPEWEAGFALQIQLRHILTMFQDWCASDHKILLEAFRDCHKVLQQCNNQPFRREASDYYMCKQILYLRPYKVSQEPVSIHLPLSRLLAGLYVLICKNGLFEQLFDKEYYDFSNLVEHPLRCVVLAAQVLAEMWRRNGLSLVSQVYYYQDVRCREEMYDKDILMLQIAASRMDANHFLMLLLIRFELLSYFNEGYSIRDHVPNRLAEEMLYLLIIIVGERYVPGVTDVTKEDVTMREVIHLLCIEPMAHSSLVKGLPDNESHETGLESVIDKVATFKKPGVSGHGLYEVKREYLVQFNPFFYHYSRSQHSKAEESQKKRRVHDGADKALRPPVPPPFCPAFSSIVHLLCCDILVYILRRLLQRAAEEKSNLWSEIMIQRALHLIGQALLEEKSQLEESASGEVTFDFSLKARRVEHNKSLFLFLSKMKGVRSLETQKDMITWLLQMFEIVKCLREKSSPTTSMSMETSKPEESAQDKEKAERKRKAEAARLHRQKIMAQMSAMQKNFIESNKMLYDNMPESGIHGEPVLSTERFSPTVGHAPTMKISNPSIISNPTEQKELCIAIGPQRGSTPAEREVLTCILCQEEQEVASQAPAMVLTACVQRSTVLTQCRGKMPSSSGNDKETSYPLFMPPELAVGTHTGSCGHVMHATCWQKYFEAVQNTSRNRLHAELIIDLENGEYLCPLCKSLCNTVVPLIPLEPLVFNYENAEIIGQHLTLTRWIHILEARIKGLQSNMQDNDCDMENINNSAAMLHGESQTDFRAILSYGVQEPRKLSNGIVEMLSVCGTTVHRVGLQTVPNELCPCVPLMAWNTCAFTIQAIENILLEEDKPLFGSLQNRQLAGLKATVQFSAAQRIIIPQAVIQRHFTEMLAVLLPAISGKNIPSILEVDFFHLLVGLVLSLPSLYQEETVDLQPSAVSSAYNHLHILHLVTMAHVLQVLILATDLPVVVGDEETEEARAAAELHTLVSQHTGRRLPDVGGSSVAERVKTGIESFLRCTALFFSCLTGVRPPEELYCTSVSCRGQMEALCSYLALPSNVFQLFQEHKDTVAPLLHRWCSSPAITKALRGKIQTVRYPRTRNQLIDLPEDYSTLLNQASHFKCPKSADDERKHPTLCLFCGTMLCSQSSCCYSQLEGEDVGACTAHAATCGAGVGMFLRVRECEIVLMASKTRGSTYPAPYLDDYGETDPHLGRGNPLHLCPERYRKLKQMWQQHCILEEIARSLELVNVMFAFDWQML
ncbi:E3 ubiquitin-protein ligase UBR1 isoform X2 [Corythoichthys intestinalis]|uniref:E3 ubiquitin-protein ligase UBR1 isoform X2 n=1 Tax=Corythoichthys intestinalis TaxID=161448 RepID=UPI0025A5A1CB|nr:E3 ubiquitin-protein ligase UBR1 isoform X2 [Corythoichthys intestinalis]